MMIIVIVPLLVREIMVSLGKSATTLPVLLVNETMPTILAAIRVIGLKISLTKMIGAKRMMIGSKFSL
jgi:hypothetical protein